MKKWIPRFRLRSLLLFVTLFSCVLAYYVCAVERQKKAVAEIREFANHCIGYYYYSKKSGVRGREGCAKRYIPFWGFDHFYLGEGKTLLAADNSSWNGR